MHQCAPMLAAVLAAACLAPPAAGPGELSGAKPGSPAPLFAVRTITGRSIALAALRGKVVLLDFGAVDCPPCRLEMPILQQWSRDYARQGLMVLGLMEMNPKPADVKRMLSDRHVTYPIAIDQGERIGKRYGLIAHPTTVLIDRRGRVVRADTGYVRGDEKAMLSALRPLLARP